MLLAAIALMAAGDIPPLRLLAKVDREFVCPEALPNDEARQRANESFVEQVQRADPKLTVTSLVDFRLAMLRKHRCSVTLRNIERK